MHACFTRACPGEKLICYAKAPTAERTMLGSLCVAAHKIHGSMHADGDADAVATFRTTATRHTHTHT